MNPLKRVRQALAAAGLDPDRVQSLPHSAATALAAAQAVQAPLGSIVKSLIFMVHGEPWLVLVAGDRRADVKALRRALGVGKKHVRIASPAEVMAKTGFAVGGVPPLGHEPPLPTIIDSSLSRFEIVWAAAGQSHAVFPIAYQQLVRITGGQVLDICEVRT